MDKALLKQFFKGRLMGTGGKGQGQGRGESKLLVASAAWWFKERYKIAR